MSARTLQAMGETSSNGPTISKKRKTASPISDTHHQHHHLPYSLGDFPDKTLSRSPSASVNSAGTVVSDEFCSDHSALSSCISSHEVVKELDTTPLDLKLQTKGFETVDSRNHNFKSFSLLNEFSGDSEETTMFPANTSTVEKVESPPEEEIEAFFATAERHEQKRFEKKYNFDIVRDMPLEGRYRWVRLHSMP